MNSMNYFRHLTLNRLSVAELSALKQLDSQTVELIAKNYNSEFYRLPIDSVAKIQQLFRQAGIKASYRYRGPRRKSYNGGLSCLRQDATHFVIYRR